MLINQVSCTSFAVHVDSHVSHSICRVPLAVLPLTAGAPEHYQFTVTQVMRVGNCSRCNNICLRLRKRSNAWCRLCVLRTQVSVQFARTSCRVRSQLQTWSCKFTHVGATRHFFILRLACAVVCRLCSECASRVIWMHIGCNLEAGAGVEPTYSDLQRVYV